MSTVVVELYEALRKAGVDDALARDAAAAVVPEDALIDLATKRDISRLELATARDISRLEGQLSELKAELIKWNVGAIAIMTAIFAAIARLT